MSEGPKPPIASVSQLTRDGNNLSKVAQSLAEITRELPNIIAYYNIDAEVKWKRFHALRKQGFTADQAVELIKDR